MFLQLEHIKFSGRLAHAYGVPTRAQTNALSEALAPLERHFSDATWLRTPDGMWRLCEVNLLVGATRVQAINNELPPPALLDVTIRDPRRVR